MTQETPEGGVPQQTGFSDRIKALWNWFWTPNGRYSFGAITLVAFVAGILFWGGFNTMMEVTNTEEFCISCHEMRNNSYAEYQQTVHYENRSGVRATCPDCHVPKTWGPKMIRKIRASNELWHKFIGSVDTPEKFEKHRLEMAERVWKSMIKTDSRECRNCHAFEYIDLTKQEDRAAERHLFGIDNGKTCIECHKGIAHKLPHDAIEGQSNPYGYKK